MADLLADENFPLPVVLELRRLGHDVKLLADTGLANLSCSDPLVLQLSAQEGRALLTINRRDFIRLHAVTEGHGGIIVCTQDPDIPGQARRIHEALEGEEALQGKLLRIYRPSSTSERG